MPCKPLIEIGGLSLAPHKPWCIQSETVLFTAEPWFTVTRQMLELADGKRIDDYYQIQAASYVEIVPVDKRGRVLVFWQYKHGARSTTLGFPAGYIAPNETASAAARRELQEECALQSGKWVDLGAYTVDGNRSVAKAHFFVAWDCDDATALNSDDLEAPEMVWISVRELREQIEAGSFLTLGALAVALRALPIIEERFKHDIL